MALSDDLIAIRLELKGQREAIEGLKSVDKAQQGIGTSTTRTGAAAASAEKKTSRLSRAYASLGKTARYGIGFLGVGGVFALKSAIENTENLAKTTSGLNRNLDLSVNVASRWGAVAHARDIDSKALTMTFTTLARKMVEAGREGGTAMTSFNMLGISQQDVIRGSRDMGWGIMRVAQAFGDAEGGAKRQAAAQGLLGKGYATILPLFSQGTKSLKEQLGWADKYGVTLDGKTNDALMDMVNAQRESRVAMLGLQISLTKALMPAIEGGQHELQKFIETLNNDDLTADQKIARIERQFLRLEDSLIDIITDALPKVAEEGGRLGLKLAGAVWHGFWESDALGKLFIGGWLFAAMGGGGAVRKIGSRVGGVIATSLGWKFLETVAPYFAAEVGMEGLGATVARRMPALKTMFGGFGRTLGTAMAVALLAAEAKYAWDHREDMFPSSLLFTPKADATSREEEAARLSGIGYRVLPFPLNPDVLKVISPTGRHIIEVEKGGRWTRHFAGGKHGGGRKGQGDPRLPRASFGASLRDPVLPRMNFMGGGGGGPRVQHIHLHWNGREIAQGILKEGEDALALG